MTLRSVLCPWDSVSNGQTMDNDLGAQHRDSPPPQLSSPWPVLQEAASGWRNQPTFQGVCMLLVVARNPYPDGTPRSSTATGEKVWPCSVAHPHVYRKEWDLIVFSLLYSGFKSVWFLSLPCYELPVLPSLRPVTKVVKNTCSIFLQIISGSLQR